MAHLRIPVRAVKRDAGAAETLSVTLERCPYDSTPITAEGYSGGSLMLTCERCGAAWEAHNSLIRRVIEPSWDEVEQAKAEQREAAGANADG